MNGDKMAKGKQKNASVIDENGTILADPPKKIGNCEYFQRMNYLYQLSLWQTVENGHDSYQGLPRMYIKNMDLISKKTKSSLLPQLKRTFCKNCHRVLVPKRTVKTSMCRDLKGNEVLEWKCVCGCIKKFPIGINRDYRTFCEKPGNLLHL